MSYKSYAFNNYYHLRSSTPHCYLLLTSPLVTPPSYVTQDPRVAPIHLPTPPIRRAFVTHLESALDGTRLEPGRLLNMHKDRPLWVRYDLAAVARAVRPADLLDRPPTLWRYRELLPLPGEAEPVTLGEGMTPLLPCP